MLCTPPYVSIGNSSQLFAINSSFLSNRVTVSKYKVIAEPVGNYHSLNFCKIFAKVENTSFKFTFLIIVPYCSCINKINSKVIQILVRSFTKISSSDKRVPHSLPLYGPKPNINVNIPV